jgi:dienelactone hydrolase
MRRSLPIVVSLALTSVGCLHTGESNQPPTPAQPIPDRGGLPGDGGASRCTASPAEVSCSHRQLSRTGWVVDRTVYFELPLGVPPPTGWPVALFFQGSFYSGERAFHGSAGDVHGQYQLALTVKALLDRGYAVLAPEALVAGTTAWQTNVPPWDLLWSSSSDDAFMQNILQAISDGGFGPLDPARKYAMGISSGGFMTSRMAVSYAGQFRALAIHSASYATCSAVCSVPTPLPADHPPTLFLHGGADSIVPIDTMVPYRDALAREGHTVDSVIRPEAGHEWLPEGPSRIPSWFDAQP